ncbi:MAG: hypothetical protein ABIF09_05800 [Gemmatimonadota bacterium]
MTRKAKSWEPRTLTLGDGTLVRMGANGKISPPVECGHCGKLIYYFKGDPAEWPWFCSPGCKAGEPINSRCLACGGVMRRPIKLFKGDSPTRVCKGCATRMAKAMRRTAGWTPTFAAFFANEVAGALASGKAQLSYLGITRDGVLAYLPKRQNVEPPVEKAKEDVTLACKMAIGEVSPDGYILRGVHQGKLYREVYRTGEACTRKEVGVI